MAATEESPRVGLGQAEFLANPPHLRVREGAIDRGAKVVEQPFGLLHIPRL